MFRFLRIVQPKNTKLSWPRLKSTVRLFPGEGRLRPVDAPLWPSGSLLPTGVCYRALRRLPGRISHPLEQRVFQDAPCRHSRKRPEGYSEVSIFTLETDQS